MAILAVLASAAACSRGSDEPSLVGAEDAFEVQAFEAGALEFSAEGIAQIVFADRSMAIRKLSFEVRGRPNGARVEVARLEARPNVPFPPGEVFQYIEVAAEGFDDLARIHRRTALGTAVEEARGCSSESGIMVL